MKLLAVVIAVVALAALALATSVPVAEAKPQPKPEDMLYWVVRYQNLNQWERAWALLVPGQQRYVPMEAFAECKNEAFPDSMQLVSWRVLAKYSAYTNILGVPQHKSTAVTVRMTISTNGGAPKPLVTTFHAIWLGTRWAWMMSSNDIVAYKNGHCPLP